MMAHKSAADSPVALLVTVIKQLSSGDSKQREFEKDKLQDDLKKADGILNNHVEAKEEGIKKTIQTFSAVASRIEACRAKVNYLRENLTTCKTLLNCNRDDFRKHWQEGLEYSEILHLLDKIDKAVAVPDQLDKFISRKHYLNATKLLVDTVESLEGNLSNVDALRELRTDLHQRKARMHEILIEELNKQIYAEPRKSMGRQKSLVSTISSTENRDVCLSASIPTFVVSHARSSSRALKIDLSEFQLDQSEENQELVEDLQGDPEDNIPLFIHLLVEALHVLGKLPEAIESLKGRIKREMALVIHRATDQVSNGAIDNGDAITVEELATRENPQLLLELLEVVFERFRTIARNHGISLNAIERAKEKKSAREGEEDIQLYTKEEVWSEIEFSVQVLLGYYLDIQSRVGHQPAMSSFSGVDSEIGAFFYSRKKGKNKYPLFRFEGSSSAIAMSSYMREQGQDMVSSIPDDPYAESLLSSKPQLLCKASGNNITVLFIPVISFINEIEDMTSSTLGVKGVLHNFITDYVRKVFVNQITFSVMEKTRQVTRGLDALRNLTDHAAQKSVGSQRPLLKSTVAIYQVIEELSTLMKKLPKYAPDFLEIMLQILGEYLESCEESYKSLVLREEIGNPSRIISASWVRDEDISRFMRSMPSWLNLQEQMKKGIKKDEEEGLDSIRARNAKESESMIGNLKRNTVAKHEVILDIGDLKSLVNLQESIDWFSRRLKAFIVSLSATFTSIQIAGSDSVENLAAQIPPIPEDTLKLFESHATDFQDLADTCLLVLHIEIRCHCFYFLIPATRQTNYVCTMDAIEVDPQIPQLTKDIRDIEEVSSAALSSIKFRYLFEGLGYLLAAIFVSSTAYIKKINRNGVRKMCQNIFTIQQELTSIALIRETDLALARQYFELLYLTPDDILNVIVEQGPQFKEDDYVNAIELLSKNEVPFDKNVLELRKRKLHELLKEWEKRKRGSQP